MKGFRCGAGASQVRFRAFDDQNRQEPCRMLSAAPQHLQFGAFTSSFAS